MKTIHEHITRIAEHIATHLDEDLSVGALSEQFTINASTLRKQFRRQFSVSLYRFVLNARMEKALLLLQEGTYSIAEVGTQVGYPEPSNFTHAFIKFYGTTPKFYANKR